MIPGEPRYVVGQVLWWCREADAELSCGRCGGGGLLYVPETDTRKMCGECRGAGRVPGVRAWVEGPRPVREVTWHEGLGVLYRIWDGETLVEVPEADLFDDPRKARERAGQRGEKRKEEAAK